MAPRRLHTPVINAIQESVSIMACKYSTQWWSLRRVRLSLATAPSLLVAAAVVTFPQLRQCVNGESIEAARDGEYHCGMVYDSTEMRREPRLPSAHPHTQPDARSIHGSLAIPRYRTPDNIH
ncbi:hypothetical protein E2C01_100606 [Portunus trituberculatus]|uniref:Uncharacterized protein n=1 Tax=Portunus trituberculatus TaxID=210409 RepID=A0A5B7KJW1_PORTR|nr:hypothetical protein [Portunus trituberculatus]